MNKMGGSGFTPKNWRRRWFVLKGGKLYYYKTSFVSIYIHGVDVSIPCTQGIYRPFEFIKMVGSVLNKLRNCIVAKTCCITWLDHLQM